MKPNWSAVAALGRALLILGAASFFGALVLPTLGDGALPATWAAWKPVLGTAFGAMVAQELIYVRTHLADAAKAIGLQVAAKMLMVSVLGIVLLGCTQVDSALNALDKAVQVVQADLEAGKTDEQIAADVCAAEGGSATTDAVCAGVTYLVQDAVQILIDSGALSPAAMQRAKQYQGAHPGACR